MKRIKLKGKHSKIEVKDGLLIKRFDKRLAYNFWKEAYFLSLLQPYKFVPKVYSINPKLLEIEMECLDGCYISDLLIENSNKEIVKNCLEICYLLDRIGIRKEEMTHPDRHIIILESKPYFIDFERAHFVALSKNPSNLTQFVNYLARMKMISIDERLIQALKAYKQKINEENFKNLLRILFR